MITKEEACRWYFGGGYEELNKLEQVEYLMRYCGYSEQGAFDLVYGCCEDAASDDWGDGEDWGL